MRRFIQIFVFLLLTTFSYHSLAYQILTTNDNLIKWNETELTVCVIDPAQKILPIAIKAYENWNIPSANVPQVKFIYCNDIPQGNFNYITYNDLSDILLGFTIIHSNESKIMRCKIFIDQNEDWSKYNMQNVLTHEFGHFLGFLDEPNETDSIMFPFSQTENAKNAQLTNNDIKGVEYLYTLDGCNLSHNNGNWLFIFISILLFRLRTI